MDEINVKPTKQEAQAIAEKIYKDIMNTFEACGCKDPWNLIKEALKASAGYEHDIKTTIHEDLFLAPDPMLGKLQGQTPKDPIFEIINSKQPAFQGVQVFRYRNEIVSLKMRYTFEKLKSLVKKSKNNKVAFEAIAELAAQIGPYGPEEMRQFVNNFLRKKIKEPPAPVGKCPYKNLWRDYAIIQCFCALKTKGYEPLCQSSTKHEDSASAIIAKIVNKQGDNIGSGATKQVFIKWEETVKRLTDFLFLNNFLRLQGATKTAQEKKETQAHEDLKRLEQGIIPPLLFEGPSYMQLPLSIAFTMSLTKNS